MEIVYGLSESDLTVLKEIVEEYRNKPTYTRSFSGDQNEYVSAEMHIARVPEGGIPALVVNTTGTGTTALIDDYISSATCQIYRIYNNRLVPIPGLQKEVYNLTNISLSEGALITIFKDKFGNWVNANIGLEFGTCS